MINKIKLKIGNEAQRNTEFSPKSVTVFIGPNNSGKSLILKELYKISSDEPNHSYPKHKIAESVLFDETSPEELDVIKKYMVHEGSHIFIRKQKIANNINKIIIEDSRMDDRICHSHGAIFSIYLPGTERSRLTVSQSSQSFSETPKNILSAILNNNKARKQASEIIYKEFGWYLSLSTVNPANISIRLSKKQPSEDHERSYKEEAINFHKETVGIEEFSDGVKMFVGLILVAFSGEEKYMFVDEPEAYLHPSLSYSLGKNLADIIQKRNGHLLASTHSPNFLRGCLATCGGNLDIFRMTYNSKNNTGKINKLDNQYIKKFYNDPVFRASNLLNALFSKNALIVEGYSDAIFYDEINYRNENINSQQLLEKGNEPLLSVPDCLFVYSRGITKIYKIIEPLVEVGVSIAVIVDLDFLVNTSVFVKVLEAFKIDNSLINIFKSSREQVHQFIKTNFPNLSPSDIGKLLKERGIGILSKSEAANKLISDLREKNIFVVTVGELENWLKNMNINEKSKDKWLEHMLKALGSDPTETNYIRPENNDVWKFIGEISEQINLSNS